MKVRKIKYYKMTKSKIDVYQNVTDTFIQSLKNNKIPWKRPWNPNGPHINYLSKRPYRGINPLLLQASSDINEFTSPYWLTYKQADQLSFKKWLKNTGNKNDKNSWILYKKDKESYCGVKLSEKSTLITYWTMFKGDSRDKFDENGNPEKVMIPFLKYIYVFNTEQTDLAIEVEKPEEIEFNPIERAEEVIENWEDKPEIKHVGDRAFYRPSTDSITMPKQEAFHSPEEYYKTLFHESVHATGHKSRLDRIKHDSFGDEKYSKEELVAEIGSSMLSQRCDIETEVSDNSIAYVQGWISKLKSDKKLIVSAAGKAQKACDLILGETYEVEDTYKKDSNE